MLIWRISLVTVGAMSPGSEVLSCHSALGAIVLHEGMARLKAQPFDRLLLHPQAFSNHHPVMSLSDKSWRNGVLVNPPGAENQTGGVTDYPCE